MESRAASCAQSSTSSGSGPDLVYATILVALVGVGALPGLLTLFLFDIGIIVKLVSEAIALVRASVLEAGRAAGSTQGRLNRTLALPQNLPLFANQWLYVLELNVRISAILGIVGAGGIGRLLDERFGFGMPMTYVSIIILEILVVVLIIEVCSNLLRGGSHDRVYIRTPEGASEAAVACGPDDLGCHRRRGHHRRDGDDGHRLEASCSACLRRPPNTAR